MPQARWRDSFSLSKKAQIQIGVDYLSNKIKTIISYAAALLLILFLTSFMLTMNKEEEVKLKYYEVLQMFENSEVESYTLDLGTGELNLIKKPEEGKDKGEKRYATANTKARMKSLFNLMFDYALEHEFIITNPARAFKVDDSILNSIKENKKINDNLTASLYMFFRGMTAVENSSA